MVFPHAPSELGVNSLTKLGGRVPLWLPVLPVPLLSLLPAALKWRVSHRHAEHTKQATAVVLTRKTWDAHLCFLLGNILELWDCFLMRDMPPHLHTFVQEDFRLQRENQCKTLTAVSGGNCCSWSWSCLPVALQKCLSDKEMHTYKHVKTCVGSMCRRSKATVEETRRLRNVSSTVTGWWAPARTFVWCLQRGKAWDKSNELNKHFPFLPHWGCINQTFPRHVNPQFTTLFTVRIIATSHITPHPLWRVGTAFSKQPPFFKFSKSDSYILSDIMCECSRQTYKYEWVVSVSWKKNKTTHVRKPVEMEKRLFMASTVLQFW